MPAEELGFPNISTGFYVFDFSFLWIYIS